jgi:hypothetical protein
MKPILANRLNSILHSHHAFAEQSERSQDCGVQKPGFLYILVHFFPLLFKAVISRFHFYIIQTWSQVKE